MTRIKVAVTIDAPPDRVWDELRHVERHVDWMADAAEIRFHGDQRSGVGTRFDCVTKVGPISMVDEMELTQWKAPSVMGVTHTGVVTGTGTFRLRARRKGRTRFVWEETLRFPWWLGGPVGGWFGRWVLVGIWRRNLAALKETVEGPSQP